MVLVRIHDSFVRQRDSYADCTWKISFYRIWTWGQGLFQSRLLNNFSANLFQHVSLPLCYYICMEKLQSYWPTFPFYPLSITFRIYHRLDDYSLWKPTQTKQNQRNSTTCFCSVRVIHKTQFLGSVTLEKYFEILWKWQNCSQSISDKPNSEERDKFWPWMLTCMSCLLQ